MGRVDRLVLHGSLRSPEVTVTAPLGRRDGQRPLRGRADVVGRLLDALAARSGPRIHVLYGMGGCGKTSVALEVAAHAEVPVWWVSAAGAATLHAGLLAVARQAGADRVRSTGADQVAPTGADPADLLWRRLAARRAGWLLVIDNADDPGLLARVGGELVDGDGWLRPVAVPGLVLVTSRDARWPGWCRRHPLGVLDAAAGAQVLLDHAAQAGTSEQARLLAARLGGLPLALRLAGSYLAATTMALIADPGAAVSFAGYLAAWRAGGGLPRAREPGGTGRDREVLGRTWELSLDLLATRGLPAARVLLRLLSMLADAPIPYRLLLEPRVVAASALLCGQDAAGLSRLLRGLSDVGLVEIDPSGIPVLRIHPLVRQASRAGRAQPELDDYHRLAVDLLCQAAGDSAGTPEVDTWPAWQLLAPHAFAVARAVASADRPVAELVSRAGAVALLAGRVLDPMGAFAQAQAELQAVYDGLRRVLGEEHPATLAERHELAVILRARGRYPQAQAELQAVYDIRRRVLGDEHRDTLASRHELGRVLRARGRYPQAQAQLQAVYDIRRRMLGDEHRDTLATRHLLAGVLRAQGRYGRAQAELAAVHEGFRRVLGEGHPRTLLTRHVLALVLRARGRYEQALAEERAVYEGLRRVLGEENPNTLLARQALAVLRHDCGQREQGHAELQTVYAAWQRELGAEHPDTLAARHDLARVLHAGGEHGAAQAHLDAVYDVRRRVLGDEHPDTLAARHDLARVWHDGGQRERAHADLQAVYGIRRRVLGSDHPDTVATRRWLRENPR
ncbi:MAG: hypothetical protein V7603_3806 [Micromonosporaceae bacterium]